MSRQTEGHSPFLLQFNHCEAFLNPPLMYDAQITVCPVKFFSRQKSSAPFLTTSLKWVVEQVKTDIVLS
jgi:hypothetical protein